MKIHTEFQQNSLEWLLARAGVVTASEFDSIMTPEFKPRTGETVKSYLALKLAEWWTGGPMPGFNTIDMEFGKIREDEAIPTYTLETGIAIQRVAFITTDDGKIGCSPDGLIGDDSGIEVKCPLPQTHVKYLLSGIVPKDYAAQVHGAMYVTGRSHWVFMSYSPRFPLLIIDVERDEEIQEKIGSALGDFLEMLAEAQERLIALNGGPPRRLEPSVPIVKKVVEDIYA
jgi:hypothetical protein